MNVTVSFLDFSHVCRVCLSREDLEAFEDETMMELFFHISNIVESKANLPQNICKECLNMLIDISVFIDISKLNDTTLIQAFTNIDCTTKEANKSKCLVVPSQFPFTCRACLSRTGLKSVDDYPHLFSLFLSITEIEMNPDHSLPNNFCTHCLEKLEQIFVFINIARRNNISLHQAIITKDIKIESTESDSGMGQCLDEKNSSKTNNTVPFEEIKLEMDVENDLKYFETHLPTNKIKTEPPIKQDSVEELNFKNELTIIENGLFTCSDCGKDHPTQKTKKDYKGKYPVSCSLCGKQFVGKQETPASKEHLQGKNSPKPRKKPKDTYRCEVCSKELVYYSSLRNHMKKHTGVDKPFRCEVCQKGFYRRYDMEFHMNSHTKLKPFQCAMCSRCFSSRTCLRVHLGVHATEKPFQCKICSKLVSSSSSLRYHMKTHSGAKPFSCEICSKSFSVKGSLNVHMRKHSGENLSECEVCFKQFVQKSELKGHMRAHTGEKPFQCKVCLKAFTLRGNLNVHMRIHAEEKPFRCDVCLKGFCQKSEMKSHMRVHTGEKPYQCEICAGTYAHKAQLKSHMRTHEREKNVDK